MSDFVDYQDSQTLSISWTLLHQVLLVSLGIVTMTTTSSLFYCNHTIDTITLKHVSLFKQQIGYRKSEREQRGHLRSQIRINTNAKSQCRW